MAGYFADTAFWIAISSRRDRYHSQAAAWHQLVVRTAGRIVTTEAVLWEWLNALSDASTRTIASIEVVPFQPELTDAAIGLCRNRRAHHGRHFEQAGFKANMLDHPGA